MSRNPGSDPPISIGLRADHLVTDPTDDALAAVYPPFPDAITASGGITLPTVNAPRGGISYGEANPADRRATQIRRDLQPLLALTTLGDDPNGREVAVVGYDVTPGPEDDYRWAARVEPGVAVLVDGAVTGAAVSAVTGLARDLDWVLDERDRLLALLVDAGAEITRLEQLRDGLLDLRVTDDDDVKDPRADDPAYEPIDRTHNAEQLPVTPAPVRIAAPTTDGWRICPLCDALTYDDAVMYRHLTVEHSGVEFAMEGVTQADMEFLGRVDDEIAAVTHPPDPGRPERRDTDRAWLSRVLTRNPPRGL